MTDLDLPPDDDAFVMSALGRLPVPDHHPDFWDQLAGRLDDAAEEIYLERVGAAAAPVLLLEREPVAAPPLEPELDRPSVLDPEPEPERGLLYDELHAGLEEIAAAEGLADVAPPPGPEPELEVEVDEPLVVELPERATPRPRPVRPAHAARPRGPRSEPLRAPAARQPEAPGPAEAAVAPGVTVFGRPTRAPRVPVVRTEDRRPGADVPRTHRLRRDPDHHHDVALVPRALRRRSNLVLAAVAVVTAVMVAVAGATLIQQRTGSDDTPATGSDADATSTSAAAPTGDALATQAVLVWLDDLSSGAVDPAWEALGERSQRHFGSRDEFEAAMVTLADGYGSWAGTAPEQVMVTPVHTDGDVSLSIVTLVGARRVDAVPVRTTDGRVEVEPYAGGAPILAVQPVPSGRVGTGDDVVVELPTDAATAVVRVDGGEVAVCGRSSSATLAPVAGQPRQRCTYAPTGGTSAGPKVLTVAYATADGAKIAALAIRYQAA